MSQDALKENKPIEVPWHAAFPSPKTTAGSVSRDEVLQWLQQGKSNFVLIDLRRTDCEVSYFPIDFPIHFLENIGPSGELT